MTQIHAENSCEFGGQANKMSALGIARASLLCLLFLGQDVSHRLPPVLILWPDFCQLGCETLAEPVGIEGLGITFALVKRWRDVE